MISVTLWHVVNQTTFVYGEEFGVRNTVLSTSALVRHFMKQKAKHIQSYKIYIYI